MRKILIVLVLFYMHNLNYGDILTASNPNLLLCKPEELLEILQLRSQLLYEQIESVQHDKERLNTHEVVQDLVRRLNDVHIQIANLKSLIVANEEATAAADETGLERNAAVRDATTTTGALINNNVRQRPIRPNVQNNGINVRPPQIRPPNLGLFGISQNHPRPALIDRLTTLLLPGAINNNNMPQQDTQLADSIEEPLQQQQQQQPQQQQQQTILQLLQALLQSQQALLAPSQQTFLQRPIAAAVLSDAESVATHTVQHDEVHKFNGTALLNDLIKQREELNEIIAKLQTNPTSTHEKEP